MLHCFEGRFWVPATEVLIRFWMGRGFAYGACHLLAQKTASRPKSIRTDLASVPFQEAVSTVHSLSSAWSGLIPLTTYYLYSPTSPPCSVPAGVPERA